jgi:flagellum-specific ATP synthase
MSAALASLPQRVRIPRGGRITSVRGLCVEASGLELAVGALAEIETGARLVPAEIVGFRGATTQLMPLAAARGIRAGDRVWPLGVRAALPPGESLLGRAIDPLGRPIDDGPALRRRAQVPLYRDPIPALARPMLEQPLDVGVRAINALCTIARGQRIGLFAGAGIGKSTLLGMMVRGTDADVIVCALIGERGREVREFIERELGPARRKSVVVAATSDEAAGLRVRGAYAATAIAEHFRDRGAHVLLVMDSVTRFALAAREIGLARGEPATTKGYTPSVFAELPRLLERAGRHGAGSVTGIYTVLVEGDDLEDPLADALRAILDGHLVLSRDLAEQGRFPALDVLASQSRAMPVVTTRVHRARALRVRRWLAAWRNAQDLIQVGAYAKGSDPDVDEALLHRAGMENFLAQDVAERADLASSISGLNRLTEGATA